MATRPDISIIGPGRVGAALGILAARAGYNVVAIGGRDEAKARAVAQAVGSAAVRPSSSDDTPSPGPSGHPLPSRERRHGTQPATPQVAAQAAGAGIVFLTVSDAAIAPLCKALAQEKCFAPGCAVVHCCGALGSDVLAPAAELCGARVASLHPLQTFPTAQAAVAAMPGTFFFAEGDAAAMPLLAELVSAIGGRFVPMSGGPRAKALYHAGACVASNYFVALMDAALAIEEAAGIDRATAAQALVPLVAATLKNIAAMGPAGALTGPISRGDAETVARHMGAIEETSPQRAQRTHREEERGRRGEGERGRWESVARRICR